MIGIFNRSYYEEVLVIKVHPEFLAKQQIPKKLVTDDIWDQRYEDIEAFERYLARNGVCIRKFFLNVSKKEQKKRFLARLDTPDKNWKFSAADIRERKLWDDYMDAYEQAIERTATKHAPWFVVPADNKWFTRLVVMAAVVDALQSLDVEYPKVTDEQRKALQAARAELE
jgi:polyphosphate kinase 2 (PPK2 family)